jgi:hypothetical protein
MSIYKGGGVTRRAVEASPQTYARIGGILYLFIIVVGVFGELFVRGRLIVPGDAAATANNIMGSETLFRVGLAGELLGYASSGALAIILYFLLKPVSRNLALLAAFLTITSNAVFGLNGLFHLAAVIVLGAPGRAIAASILSPTIWKPSIRSNCMPWHTCRSGCMVMASPSA